MPFSTIVAKNLTGSAITLIQLSVTVPAAGTANLSDGNSPAEIQNDPELLVQIDAGAIVLVVNGIEFSTSESQNFSNPYAGAPSAISVYDNVGGQVFTGTVTIVFDVVSKNLAPGVFTFNAVTGEVQVSMAGAYELTFNISLDGGSNTRVTSRSFLQRQVGGAGAWADIPGTDAYGYHRSNQNGLDTASATLLVDLTALDKVRVQAQRLGTSGTLLTVVRGSRLTLRKVA